MTLKDVRPFAILVAGWCLAQDDLIAFTVAAHDGGVYVSLDWPHRWIDAREFTVYEVRTMGRDDVIAVLDMMAAEYRDKTAKFRDPGRLPV